MIGASVGALVESIFGTAGTSYAARRRLHAHFTTVLSVSDVLAAISDAASVLPGCSAEVDPPLGKATVSFESGGSVAVGVMAGRDGNNQVRVVPARPGASDDTLARFRSSMLAALRRRDPTTSHG